MSSTLCWRHLNWNMLVYCSIIDAHSDICTLTAHHPPPLLPCSDIWRTGPRRESWFWEVRRGEGLAGWGCEVNNTSRVQRACLMCSLSRWQLRWAGPPHDKLSTEVSCSCCNSLPRSLTLSISFPRCSCPSQRWTLPALSSSNLTSVDTCANELSVNYRSSNTIKNDQREGCFKAMMSSVTQTNSFSEQQWKSWAFVQLYEMHTNDIILWSLAAMHTCRSKYKHMYKYELYTMWVQTEHKANFSVFSSDCIQVQRWT